MRRLVESWIEAEKSYGYSLAEAIRQLNQDRSMALTHSRVAEWRNGKYAPSHPAISYMLYNTLPWAIKKAGIQATDEQMDALDELLWKTKITDGERHIELL
jgi:hypothetical protein